MSDSERERERAKRGDPRAPDRDDPRALEEVSTADLVRDALDEIKELVRIEVEMAKSELEQEVKRAKHAAIAIGVSAAAGILVLCMLVVAAVLALGGTPVVALAAAGLLLVVGGAFAVAGYVMFPKRPLEQTRQHLKTDVGELKELKERIA